MALLYLLLLALTCYSDAQEDCSVFHEGACPLEVLFILQEAREEKIKGKNLLFFLSQKIFYQESNILGMSSDIANGAECQVIKFFANTHMAL